MKASPAIDVKAFIDQRPMSSGQWLILFLCFLIVVADGLDVAVMGFIAPAVIAEWNVTRAAFGLVIGAAPLGLVFGALIAGPLADRIGRKLVLIASVLIFGLITLATAFARNPSEMAALRLLAGLGFGAAMPNTTTLLSEYVPERARSFLVAIMFMGFGVGSALIGFAAAHLIPAFGWRSVLIFGGVFPLVLLPFVATMLPESVRFMVMRNAPPARIAAALSRACRTRLPEGATFFAPEPPATGKRSVALLLSTGYGPLTARLWITYFLGLLVIYLINGWLPTLIKDAGLPISAAANITAMFQAGGVAGCIAAGWSMDRTRPNWVIAAGYAGGAACMFGVAASGPLSPALIWWVAAAGFFVNGAQTGMNAYAPSCYPTAARATGVSWMQGMGRFGSIFGSAVGGVLLGFGWQFSSVVALLAVPAAMAAMVIVRARSAQSSAKSAPSPTSKVTISAAIQP